MFDSNPEPKYFKDSSMLKRLEVGIILKRSLVARQYLHSSVLKLSASAKLGCSLKKVWSVIFQVHREFFMKIFCNGFALKCGLQMLHFLNEYAVI